MTAWRRPILAHAAGHPRGLQRVVPGRLARLDVAEATPAGARVAEDHERGRAPLPALADVRAGRLLADRVQVLGLDERGQLAVLRAAGRRHLEPRRLAAAVGLDSGPSTVSTSAMPPGLALDRVTCSRALTNVRVALQIVANRSCFVAAVPAIVVCMPPHANDGRESCPPHANDGREGCPPGRFLDHKQAFETDRRRDQRLTLTRVFRGRSSAPRSATGPRWRASGD